MYRLSSRRSRSKVSEMSLPNDNLHTYLLKPPEYPNIPTVQAFRVGIAGTDEAVLVTFDADGNRQLLVPQPDGTPDRAGHLTKFISQETGTYLDRETSRPGRYLALTCTNRALTRTFESLINEYIAQLEDLEDSPLKTFEEVFSAWKSLLRETEEGISEQTLVGLFGELVVLKTLAEVDPVVALESWTGPLNEGADFKTAFWNIEAKTTKKLDFRTLNVSNPLQFSPAGELPLYLARVAISEQAGGKTIPQLADEIKDLGVESLDLDGRIRRVSNEVLDDESEKRSFLVTDLSFYKVDESFPHVPGLDEGTLPEGISNLRYDVDLSFARRLTATEVDQLVSQLTRQND